MGGWDKQLRLFWFIVHQTIKNHGEGKGEGEEEREYAQLEAGVGGGILNPGINMGCGRPNHQVEYLPLELLTLA